MNTSFQDFNVYNRHLFKLPGAFAKSFYSTNIHDKLTLEFPTSMIEFKRTKKNNSKIIKMLKENLEDEQKNLNSMKKRIFVMEYLPYLYQLIQPNIREINPELLNYKEKSQVKQAISLMTSLGLKFRDIEEDNNSYYEPDIQSLLDFKLENAIPTRMTERMKIIVSSELETFKHLKDSEKMFPEMRISIKQDESLVKKGNGLNLTQISLKGAKRKVNQAYNPDYKFIYKFNEGVTNKVNRSLNINYFFSN